MKNKIKKIIPVGIKPETEIWIFSSSLFALGIIYSVISYASFYSYWYNNLFNFQGGKRVLISGRMMPDFHEIIDGCFNGFVIAIFIFIFLIVYHYGYHYKDSKSIYTMKRLPNKSELHIRCLAVPVIGIILCLVFALCLILIFYYYYMAKTPTECLFPDQWERLWTNIIYGG